MQVPYDAIGAIPASIATFLPEVNQRVRSGQIGREDALIAWEQLRMEVDEPVKAVILHGSVAKERAAAFSDIDLLVLVAGLSPPRHFTRIVLGYLLDVTILSMEGVTAAAQKAGKTRLSGEITGILEGTVIAGDPTILERARTRVLSVLASEGQALQRLMQGIEARLLGRLMDLCALPKNGRIRALIIDIHGLCSSLATLRAFGQMLPLPVAYERLDREVQHMLSTIDSWSVEDPIGLVDYVLLNFRITTFARWDEMLPP